MVITILFWTMVIAEALYLVHLSKDLHWFDDQVYFGGFLLGIFALIVSTIPIDGFSIWKAVEVNGFGSGLMLAVVRAAPFHYLSLGCIFIINILLFAFRRAIKNALL